MEKKWGKIQSELHIVRDRNRRDSVFVLGAIWVDFRSDLVHFGGHVNAHI